MLVTSIVIVIAVVEKEMVLNVKNTKVYLDICPGNLPSDAVTSFVDYFSRRDESTPTVTVVAYR